MEDSFAPDLGKIVNDNNYPTYIRELAMSIKQNGYHNVGDFFRGLYDYEAQELVDIMGNSSILSDNNLPDEFPYSFNSEILAVLTMMLNLGEGGPPPTEDSLFDMLSRMSALALVTSLDKKQMCEAIYDNFTLQPDGLDLEVARAI